MNVQEFMSTSVETVSPGDHLNLAAQIMWEHDCGALPVVDAESRVVGMLTDRDICMAAYTQGRALSQITVSSACAHVVQTCKLADSVQTAESLMAAAQVRRIPVVDGEGKLRGVVSLGDLAKHVHRAGRKPDGLSYESVANTLAAISQSSLADVKASAQTIRGQERQAQPAPAHV
jgi:CBS domain-containing protein